MFFNQFFGFDDSPFDYPSGGDCTPNEPVDNDRLYEVLGVPKDATNGQIRKAYLLKARQMHPDKGGNPVEFQALSTAYEVLSNEDKRKKYDQYGERYLKGEISQYNDNSDDSDSLKQTEDVRKSVACSLEDLYKGKNINMKITHKVLCKACHGEGGKPGYKRVCRYCKGKGCVYMQLNEFFIQRTVAVPCDYCDGKGYSFNASLRCPICRGTCLVQENKPSSVYLEPGMGNNSIIRIPGAADESPGLSAGDVLLVIKERPHAIFERKGPDLRMHMTISLGEALCGFVRPFQHLDNRTVYVRCAPGEVKPGSIKVLKGEGMPLEGDFMKHGSLFIQFDVEYPQYMTNEQLEVLRAVFNTPAPVITQDMEVCDLQDGANLQFGESVPNYQSRSKEAYNEDSSTRRVNVEECPVQ